VTKDYKTEAEKTVDSVIRDKGKRLLLYARSMRIFLCGDYDGEILSALESVRGVLIKEGYNPFLLSGIPESEVDHLNKEILAFKKADIVMLVDGKRAGTWTESVLSMLQDRFGKKLLFFYDGSMKTVEDVANCQDYHVYFLSKCSYTSKEDLINKITLFAKQAAHHEACRLLREDENK